MYRANGFPPVACLPGQNHVRLVLKNGDYSLPKERMVINDEYSNRLVGVAVIHD